MARDLARTFAATGAMLLLLAPAAAGCGEFADRLLNRKGGGGLEESRRLSDAVRAGKLDREAVLADVCDAVRSDERFVDEIPRGVATNLLCSMTRESESGRMVIDHPLQVETLLLLSSDAHVSVRVNSLQAFRHADGSAELLAKVEQRCHDAAQSDDSAMVRRSSANALGALVDRVDDAAWKKKWCPEFLRLASDPIGDQIAAYARVEAADPMRSMRDWQIDFRAAFLRSIAIREGCRAALTAAETFDVRGRIAALEALEKAIYVDFGRPPARQTKADYAACAEWVAQAGHWIDVPRLPAYDPGVDEEGRPIEAAPEVEPESVLDGPLISAMQALAIVARQPTCDEKLRARIAEVIEQAGASGSERVHALAEELLKQK